MPNKVSWKILFILLCWSILCCAPVQKTWADEDSNAEYNVSQNLPVEEVESGISGSMQLLQNKANTNTTFGKKAILRFVDTNGQTITEEKLDAPVAKIEKTFLYGTKFPTYLVTIDLMCDSGSFCGPSTMLIEIRDGKFTHIRAIEDKNEKADRLWLGQSLKNAWKLVLSANGKGQEIEQIQCHPNWNGSEDEFVIAYSSFRFEHSKWHRYTREKMGFGKMKAIGRNGLNFHEHFLSGFLS